jgi:hypothetical protein
VERTNYLRLNTSLVREAAQGYEKDGAALEHMLAVAAEDRLGRVYAGQGRPGQGWGGDFQVGWVPVYSWFPPREMDALGYLHHMWSLNADFHDRFDERREEVFRAFGVRRIVAPVDRALPPFAREIAREGRFRVLAVDGPGLVEVVDAPYTVTADKRTVSRLHRAWLKSELAGRDVHPLLRVTEEGPVPADAIDGGGMDFRFPPVPSPPGPPGEVREATRQGDDFAVRVRADRAAVVMLRMSFHPGWRATVDGRAAATVHLVPSYVGVRVEPGEHEVRFRWDPGPTKAILLALGLLPLALLLVWERRRSR